MSLLSIPKNLKITSISYIVFSGLCAWIMLFLFCLYNPSHGAVLVALSAPGIVLVLHAITIGTLLFIYKRFEAEDKKIITWFIIVNIWLLIVDICFYIATQQNMSALIRPTIIHFLLYYMPCIMYCIMMCAVILKLLLRYTLTLKEFMRISLGLLFINTIILYLFLSSIEYAFATISWEIISQVTLLSFELVLFSVTILALIYADNSSMFFMCSGVITLISGDFFLTYSYMSQTSTLFPYGQLLWILGLLFIMFSVLNIKIVLHYKIRLWFRKHTAIKSMMAFVTFNFSIGIFLIFLILAYSFSLVNRSAFIGLPLAILIYSVTVILISIVIGKIFEIPFKKIENNIKYLILKDSAIKKEANFAIDEFAVMQNFILNTYYLIEEKAEEKKEFNMAATQVAHDIRSPVAAILMLAKESVELPEEPRTLLRDAAHRIQDIANNLLDKTRERKASHFTEKDTFFLASAAILSVISEKKVEYKNTQINIIHEFRSDAVFSFIQTSLTEFKRVISNLINNAVEAMNTSGQIIVRLSHKDDSIDIDIIDAGNGMPQSTIDAVMKGESISSKSAGLGLGLSHAKTFLQSCGAQLNILSTINGTTVSLIFKKRSDTHCWIANEIKLNSHATIVILDDDISIHGAWDRLLTSFSKAEGVVLKIMHFTQGVECLTYLRQLQAKERDDLIMLTDYKLIKQDMNGLDVIEQSELQRAILVTSYYDNEDVIKKAMLLNTKILPKMLVSDVKLTLVI